MSTSREREALQIAILAAIKAGYVQVVRYEDGFVTYRVSEDGEKLLAAFMRHPLKEQ